MPGFPTCRDARWCSRPPPSTHMPPFEIFCKFHVLSKLTTGPWTPTTRADELAASDDHPKHEQCNENPTEAVHVLPPYEITESVIVHSYCPGSSTMRTLTTS